MKKTTTQQQRRFLMNMVNVRAHCMRPALAAAITLAITLAFLGCADIPEELRDEANGECGGSAYYNSPGCPGYSGVYPSSSSLRQSSSSSRMSSSSSAGSLTSSSSRPSSSSSSRPSSSSINSSSSRPSSSSDPCSGNAYYSNPSCGGYYSCPSGYGCDPCSGNAYYSPGCPGYVSGGSVRDSRDGQAYSTVQIGGQNWMAENLNYNASGSACYGNQSSNCSQYGRLYDWATAMALPSTCNSSTCASSVSSRHQGICPSGWHIPTQAEWNTLSSYVESASGCSNCDAWHLKATSGWYDNGNGLDSYGFAALPGGFGYPDGYFDDAGGSGHWWGASESGSGSAYYRFMYYDYEYADWSYGSKAFLYSVRCLQD